MRARPPRARLTSPATPVAARPSKDVYYTPNDTARLLGTRAARRIPGCVCAHRAAVLCSCKAGFCRLSAASPPRRWRYNVCTAHVWHLHACAHRHVCAAGQAASHGTRWSDDAGSNGYMAARRPTILERRASLSKGTVGRERAVRRSTLRLLSDAADACALTALRRDTEQPKVAHAAAPRRAALRGPWAQ